MKLLLTSAGIKNQTIADALIELVDKPAPEIKVTVIPTAANPEAGNKDWFIDQFTNLQRFGFSWIDMVDPSADGVDWQKSLEPAEVVFVSGGNTFHLLDQVRKTGFDRWLREALEHKVYVGASAGTILMTPSIGVASVDNGDENIVGLTDLTGLGYVDFEISPHTPEFVSLDANKQYAKTIKNKLYCMDDNMAIKVDGHVEMVGEGEYEIL